MIIQNIMEDIVWQQLDIVLERYPEACRCEKCRADIVAYTLNKMRPHYVVSERGAILAKAQSLESSFRIELLVYMAAAVKQVQEHPRHD
jgi:competence protein ComFB